MKRCGKEKLNKTRAAKISKEKSEGEINAVREGKIKQPRNESGNVQLRSVERRARKTIEIERKYDRQTIVSYKQGIDKAHYIDLPQSGHIDASIVHLVDCIRFVVCAFTR